MFVGQTGIGRVIQRTCEVLKEHPDADPREHGAFDFPTIQRYINFWSSSSNDLFGSEISTNAANFFAEGIKGRANEERFEDHVAREGVFAIDRPAGHGLSREEVPLRNAMNEVLREDYIADNQKGIDYWNRIVEKNGLDFRFRLPHKRFHRTIGLYAGGHFDPDGNPLDEAEWNRCAGEWLPTEEDRAFVKKLMQPVREPGRIAGWIAPPPKGINGNPFDFEYVRL